MNTIKELINSVKILIFFSVICGIVYPLLVTAIAQVAFPFQANGSLIVEENKVKGSALIGQNFTDNKYFWGRPSAVGYNAQSSGGSNLSQNNPQLIAAIAERQESLAKANNISIKEMPIDLLTTSASGLDPHISPAAAELQVKRVAGSRGLPLEKVRNLVAKNTEQPDLNVLGERRVNVLKLNLDLDKEIYE